ncbi:MAG: dihydropteroate synthase [Candidatus Zixiibacteriota bacterium]
MNKIEIPVAEKLSLPGGRHLDLTRPLVMGVINVTPDSFSDGGRYHDLNDAVARAEQMINDSADIIDIGGESSRPGSVSIHIDEELRRTIPVIKAVRRISSIPISIDSTKSEAARQAIDAGADIINDISALRFDNKMAEVAAGFDGPVVLMHMLGTPKTMQADPHYDDCIREIREFFEERLTFCGQHGIERTRIILDPGIGFGKRLEDNINIIKNFRQFSSFGCPLLMGASRKSFIAMITGIRGNADKRIGGSLAALIHAIHAGCNILRVHDVAETVEAIKVMSAIEDFQQ